MGATQDFTEAAEGYDTLRTEETPVRKWIETPEVRRVCGTLDGLECADLACSDGHFAFELLDLGARHVHGVDISDAMIALAQKRAVGHPISLQHSDVMDLDQSPKYDFVFSSFATSYAPDVPKLFEMCKVIAAQVRPGGRVVGLCEPDRMPGTEGYDTRKYGKTKAWRSAPKEGDPVDIVWMLGGKTVPFSCIGFFPQTIQAAFEAAGLTEVTIHRPRADDAAKAAFPDGFWADLDACPLFSLYSATKPAV